MRTRGLVLAVGGLAVAGIAAAVIHLDRGATGATANRARQRAERVAAQVREYDANGNGHLDAAEREALMRDRTARLRELTARLYARFDLDRNQAIDPAEAEAIKAGRERLGAFKGKALERYDANRDGTLDESERATMRSTNDAWVADLKRKVLERFDANRNGVLDPEEKQAMQALVDSRRRSTP
jgi:hypothetical protein